VNNLAHMPGSNKGDGLDCWVLAQKVDGLLA
jgi:hypothetical protein